MIECLKEKRIDGAVLDVFKEEQIKINNPLLKLNNIILSPHNARISDKSLDLSFKISIEEIIRIAEGKEPVNKVNYDK